MTIKRNPIVILMADDDKDDQLLTRDALAESRVTNTLVVILTTSKTEQNILNGYDLGAAFYLTNPVTFEGLVNLMRALGHYWMEFVELPTCQQSCTGD